MGTLIPRSGVIEVRTGTGEEEKDDVAGSYARPLLIIARNRDRKDYAGIATTFPAFAGAIAHHFFASAGVTSSR